MLRFTIDWEDEPRVQDRLLRATWARLEIHARDGAREFCLTDCVGERSHSLRRGIYGSVFPVAAWVVENWWSLLNESLRTDRFRGGRALANDSVLRPWVQRHSFLAARGGFALPDLTLYRDGARIAARCVPDPFGVETPYPVRFVSDAEIRLCPADAEEGLLGFVDAVTDRVRELTPDAPEARELLQNWEAVRESARTEQSVCAAAAAMGVDPYDPRELTEELLAILEGPFRSLPLALRWDLAESTAGQTASTDLQWVLAAAEASGLREPPAAFSGPPADSGATTAHGAGYERARWFADRFGVPPADDLEGFIRDRCGWAPTVEPFSDADGVALRINALVGPDATTGRPRLIPSASSRRPESKRFLLGRALFFTPTEGAPPPLRLLTRASSWPQRASRAFAAELLVPADELRRRVSGQVTFEEVGELAREFRVSEMVVEHQLENHRLAHIINA
jgi:hypothetical protein